MDFTVTFISNSGFIFETDEHIIVMDYQGDKSEIINEKLLEKRKKLLLLASHQHGDHYSPKILDFAGKKDAAILLSDDIYAGESPSYIGALEKTELLGVKIEAYGSTDLGVSFMLEIGGKRIFHAGDLNFWHWMDESTPEETAEARHMFESVISVISRPVDIAFFPVDPRLGTSYDLGADMFLEKFTPKLFFPMHFREAAFAADDFAKKHSDNEHGTKIIPLKAAGETFGGSI